MTNPADRGTQIKTFLKDGDVTFSSYSFDERQDSAKIIRITLLAVLIPVLSVAFAIVVILYFNFRSIVKRT